MLYSRDKTIIRWLIKKWYDNEKIINFFPRKIVTIKELNSFKSKMRKKQYFISKWKKYWHCRSCDSWKEYTLEFFQNNWWRLCSTCKECRNRRKKNMYIINQWIKNKITCIRYNIRKSIKKVLQTEKN